MPGTSPPRADRSPRAGRAAWDRAGCWRAATRRVTGRERARSRCTPCTPALRCSLQLSLVFQLLQQTVLDEGECGVFDGGEVEPGALGHVEKGVVAVGQVQHPEQTHLPALGSDATADGCVQAPLAELRLALGVEV